MKLALVGLSQPGKSTLMSALTGKDPALPGQTKVTEETLPVPDERLDWLTEHYNPKKKVNAMLSCIDVPSFNYADKSGQAAAKRFFDGLRKADMFVFVVRAFEGGGVAPNRGRIDPAADIQELLGEFLIADMEMCATRIANLEKSSRKPTDQQARDKEELELQKKLQAILEEETLLSDVELSEREQELIHPLGFFTLKPVLAVVNVDEDGIGEEYSVEGNIPVLTVAASIEQEIAQLEEEDAAEFMNDLGITEPASHRFIQQCYSTMGLDSFFTVGPDECRAWTIDRGTLAPRAAGKVHSDIERGFIRAETFSYDDLKELGDEKALKEAGKIRLEGKEYIVKDGDIINFRFSV